MTNQENPAVESAIEGKRVMIEVTNTRDAFMVVATRILDPKQTGKIPFYNMRQLEDAQTAERNKLIKIKTEITDEIIEALGGEVEEKETPTDPEGGEGTETPTEPEEPTDPKEPEGGEGTEEPTDPKEPEGGEGTEEPKEPEVPEETEVPETPEEVTPPTAEEIDGMTMKEIKDYIVANELDVPGYTSMNATELKAAFKKALGYEVEEEVEDDTELE